MNRLIFFLYLIVLPCFSIGQDSEAIRYSTDDGFVKFISDAPLEFITAESNDLSGLLDMNKRTFAFRLDVKSLKGFNSPLQQEHFYENYIESDKFPTASFSGKIIESLEFGTDEWQTYRAKGILDIHGVSQERIINCDIRFTDNKIEVKSSFIVLLAEHNITIPKLVYQKISEEIRIEVRATMFKERGTDTK